MQVELNYLHLVILVAFYVASIACIVHAIMDTRTAQGAVAWTIGLVSFPYLALPLYLIFGRRRFVGYVTQRRISVRRLHDLEALADLRCRHTAHLEESELGTLKVLEQLARMPFTHGNGAKLLIDGTATFQAILNAIDAAERYVLVQFFIVRDDGLGRRLAEALSGAAARGLHVCLLFDEIGSAHTSSRFFRNLRDAGVEASSFNSSKRRFTPWQVNFRNHRKIVVIDGDVAYVGGHNVGDEYLGLDPAFGRWRDTHVELTGPIVEACQVSFYEDWYWSTGKRLKVDWTFEPSKERDMNALVLPSGPADTLETGSLLFTQMINTARKRLWVVSPYFVPDASILSALQLAALRGVDVRVMVPDKPDHKVVWLAAFAYFKDAGEAGIKFYRYTGGFLHQKVMLVDDNFAVVGTANLDNRSLRLNFEISILFADPAFAGEVKTMLVEDFKNCRLYSDSELDERSWPFRFATRAARLAAPIL